MASTDPIVLTKNVWTKVFTNVTYQGSVFIVDYELETKPTSYLVAFVNTGDPAPLVSFDGGIPFDESFSPSNSIASDYYIMPTDYDGKVVILV